jgi:hypothetical protein
MLEAYINQNRPLTVFIESSKVEFKNMNSMTIQEIYSLIEATKKTNRYSTILKLITIEDKDEVLPNLSQYNLGQLFEEWEKHCGVQIKDVNEVFEVIETYSKEFQTDLNSMSQIKTITEFLSLPVIDMVVLTKSLLYKNSRKSHVVSAIQGQIQPWGPENTIELMLLTLVNILRNWFKMDSVSLTKFIIKKTDNQLEELVPTDEKSAMSKDEMDEKIKKWQETGTF